MHKVLLSVLVLATVMIFSGEIRAQAPAVPDKMPNDIPYGNSIGLDQARKIAAAVEEESKKRGWKMSIAVVDTHGDLVYLSRMDSTQLASIRISEGKARTAVRFRRPSQAFFEAMETGHPYVATLDPTIVASAGGLLLLENGKIIGGIGCSGGTGAQDALVCKVGADMVK